MTYRNIALIAIAALACSPAMRSEQKNLGALKSPDGKLLVELTENNGTVNYSLKRGGAIVVEQSPLGIVTSEGDFSSGVTAATSAQKKIDSTFTLPAAKRSRINDLCNEVTVNVTKEGKNARFVVRLYNEGMAWRYEIDGSGDVTVSGETGGCVLPAQQTIMTQPLCQGTRGSFAESDTELLECMRTASLPLMAGNGDNTVILAETAPTSGYCGSRLTVSDGGALLFTPVETVATTLPLATPWRMVLAAPLNAVAESSMAECLGTPASADDFSWVKPGRAASAFAGEDHMASYLDMDNIRSYIDWASQQGWEYFTLDKSWRQNGIRLQDVVSYARSKNVGVFVWLSRHALPAAEGQMRTALQEYKTAGVKGVKVEFWEDEFTETVNQRNTLLKVAAEKQLMVILANSVNTAGLNRTWPNLMGTENGLNNSCYCFTPDLVGAAHNISSAILKAPYGPTDYYPVDFAEHNGKLLQSTTHAHQLALAVMFHSGVQHISDAPANLRHSMAKEILKTIPAAWDETCCTEAAAGEYITMVRRSGADRYIGTLAAEARTAEISLDFLNDGETVNAYIYRDGSCPTDIAFEYKTGLTKSDAIAISLARNGGALVKLTAADNEVKPYCVKYEAEAHGNTIPFGVSVLADATGFCSGGEFVAGAGNGRSLFVNNISVPETGTYAVTVYYMADKASAGYVKLNGSLASIRALDFINSGGTDGRALAQTTVSLQFDRTEGNSIEINSSEALPGIDRITVTDNQTLVSGVENVVSDPAMPGRVYGTDGAVAIEQPSEASYTVHNTLGRLLAAGKMEAGSITVPVHEKGIVIVSLATPSGRFAQKVIIR